MKQILITPGSTADTKALLAGLEGFRLFDCYRPEIAFYSAMNRCTAVVLTDAPANPPGWTAVETAAPDCSAAQNNPETLHLTTP